MRASQLDINYKNSLMEMKYHEINNFRGFLTGDLESDNRILKIIVRRQQKMIREEMNLRMIVGFIIGVMVTLGFGWIF